MARKTKDDAAKTRTTILNAAEKVFYQQGVSSTSLEQIARAAHVTRGAVYWHFRNKDEVCEAMADRVFLPQEDMLERLSANGSDTPLDDLRQTCCATLHTMMTNKRSKRVATIINLRCEYIDNLSGLMRRRRACKESMLERCERFFQRAQKLGQLSPVWTPRLAAVTFQALMIGLMNAALEERQGVDFITTSPSCIDAFFKSLKRV